MLKFLPATSEDIRIGAIVRVRHDDPKKPTVQGAVVERRKSRTGTFYFTVAREIDSVAEYFRLDEWAPFSVDVLRDTDKAIASFMRRLRYRWTAADPLREPRALKGGPFCGEHYASRTHEGDTLVFTAKGMTGSYRGYTWQPIPSGDRP